MITLLFSVFFDLRYFLLFFGLVIGAFSVALAILLTDTSDDYNQVKAISVYILALRQSIGDYDTSTVTGDT